LRLAALEKGQREEMAGLMVVLIHVEISFGKKSGSLQEVEVETRPYEAAKTLREIWVRNGSHSGENVLKPVLRWCMDESPQECEIKQARRSRDIKLEAEREAAKTLRRKERVQDRSRDLELEL
jgi:hypothetical protein